MPSTSHTDLGAIYTPFQRVHPHTLSKIMASTLVALVLIRMKTLIHILSKKCNIFLSNSICYERNGINTANNTITGNYGKNRPAISSNTIVSDSSKISDVAKKRKMRNALMYSLRSVLVGQCQTPNLTY